jgi:hypothetical protein
VPPEAEVIRLAREAMDMTAQDAAEASRSQDGRGVSAAYWRDVERGYGGRRGQRVKVRASDRALAAMARVVGVQPSQLTAAGREDAARVLDEALRREAGTPPSRPAGPPLPEFTPQMAADMATYVDEVRLRVTLARRHHPDGPLTGREVFPLDPRSAFFWDTVTTVGFRQEEGVIQGTAVLMTQAAQEDAAEQAKNTATGLLHGRFAGHPRRIHSAFARA